VNIRRGKNYNVDMLCILMIVMVLIMMVMIMHDVN